MCNATPSGVCVHACCSHAVLACTGRIRFAHKSPIISCQASIAKKSKSLLSGADAACKASMPRRHSLLAPTAPAVLLQTALQAVPDFSLHCVCCCIMCARLTKDTTNWKNKKEMLDTEQAALANLHQQLAELHQDQLTAKVEAATAARDEAAAAQQAAEQGVQAATRELAGVVRSA